MDRWTIEELEKIDDIEFAVAILNERRNRLNPYSPLSTKLRESANTLTMIRAEKERFLARIMGQQIEEAENV